MNRNIKMMVMIGVLSLLTVIFLTGTQVYFHHKEIKMASDGCFDIGGTPKVEKDWLAINYSFSCEKDA